MQVLSLCEKDCPDHIPYSDSLGKEVGAGADGQVFEIKDSNKVIKYCVLYENYSKDLSYEFEKITQSICYIRDYKPSICARVYDFSFLAYGSRKIFNGLNQKYIIYYYTMEKLYKISEDEKKVFHTILSHEDRGIVKNFSEEKLRETLFGLSRGLDFDGDRVILFYNNLKNFSIRHLDIHVRNIMKDSKGNFRLIDFDRVEIGDSLNE